MECARPQPCEVPDRDKEYLYKESDDRYIFSPFIVTFCEGTLTDIDIQNFLEAGLRIVRFRIGHMQRDKLDLMDMLKTAVEKCCTKYGVATWPVAVVIDLPNGLIQTGFIRGDSLTPKLNFQKGNFVELTCDVRYRHKCSLQTIYVDDKQIFKSIKPGQQICIPVSSINLVCTEVINEKTIKCEILTDGVLISSQVVTFRGIKYTKPVLTELDMELLEFVRKNEIEIVLINSIRRRITADSARNFFMGYKQPLIFGCIGEQEGLDNVDEIIEACDGLVLAREYLYDSIDDFNQMTRIQLNICARCRQNGKPVFISGNIFEETMASGCISFGEVHDVSNIVLQGAGLIVRNAYEPENVLKCLYLLNSISRSIQPLQEADYWRLTTALQPPVTAADAAVIATAAAARQFGAHVVIVLTVTGKTAMQLSCFYPNCFIVTVTTHARTARQLQLFHGVIPIIYNKKGKDDWNTDMRLRVEFALKHCIRHSLLNFNDPYAILRKARPNSAFCDVLSLHNLPEIVTEHQKCPDKRQRTATIN